ncbi:hypothetical protein [Rhodanobacter terrae]|uniref:Elongation factor-1 alpha n=1 Tax=Rhodanobacter terrae TaxID=418647 RepID=A0ABW0SSP0_9GAMM
MNDSNLPGQKKLAARISALVIGTLTVLAPWYISGPLATLNRGIFWTYVITGVLMATVAIVALIWRHALWPAWAFFLLTVWIILAPDTLSSAAKDVSIMHLILGAAGIVVSVFWIRRMFGRIPQDRPVVKGRTFRECSSSERTLYGLVICVLGLGYCMALGYLYMTHAGLNGKPGISVQDIAITYYGNRSGTRLELMLRGQMRDKISPDEMDRVVAWLKSGSTEDEYDDTIYPIIMKDCASCHSAKSGKNLRDYTTYEGIIPVATVDHGMSIETLVKLSHIHLFGIGLVTFVLGFVFCFSTLPAWFKNVVIVAPFFAMVIDIATWYLTKWDPVFAYTVVVSGLILGSAWGIQIFVSLYQIIFLPAAEKKA